MFRSIVTAALIAGLTGGFVMTVVEAAKLLPLIHEAETYEAKAREGGGASGGHAHEHAAGERGAEFGRFGLTVLANILTGVGFALILTAAASLRGGFDWRRGLAWGLGGYAAFSLAPSLGLPPELPGMAAGDLQARQLWWILTVASTAGGLALIAFIPRPWLKGLGALLIVVPHVAGAPHPAGHAAGGVPAELAAAFVSASLVATLLLWLTIGAVSGYAFPRIQARSIR